MSNLAGPWAGNIYGTNTGKVFIEFEQENGNLKGTARLNDDSHGVVVFQLTGTAGDDIELNSVPEDTGAAGDGAAQPESVQVRAKLAPDGSLKGRWETTEGTAGLIVLFRHTLDAEPAKAAEPAQIYNRTIKLGSVRIFKEDVARVLDIARKDFSAGLIVTYDHHGSEVSRMADDFIREIDELVQLRSLKMFITEPGKAGLNRQVNIDLLESGDSTIRVSGPEESWVLGKAESASKALSPYQPGVLTNYKKYGLNMNFLLFVGMVVLMPSIHGLPRRGIFAAAVLALVFILFAVHTKFIPNTLILIKAKPRGPLALAWPSILSWLLGVSSTVVAGLIFWYLTKP